MNEIRVTEFAADPRDEQIGARFDSLVATRGVVSGGSSAPTSSPVSGGGSQVAPPSALMSAEEVGVRSRAGTLHKDNDITNPPFLVEFMQQIGGGVEDGFKNTMNAFVDLSTSVNNMLPEGLSQDKETVETNADFLRFDLSEPVVGITSRVDTAGAVLNVTRSLSQFLIPFGAASKVATKTMGLKGTANAVVASSATGYLAIDPAEDNLANTLNEVPWLQNPVTEFLASDGGSNSLNRVKNAISEGILLIAGVKIAEGVGAGVKEIAKTSAGKVVGEKVSQAVSVVKKIPAKKLNPKLAKLVDTFVDGLGVVKGKRDLSKQGFDSETYSELSGLKVAAEKDLTFKEVFTGKIVSSSAKGEVDDVLTGALVAGRRAVLPGSRAIKRVASEKDDFVKKIYGKGVAEFDADEVLKSSGLVDDPVISDLLKFASSKAPKTNIPWDETNANAFGMSVDEAMKKFGTAGELTSAMAAVKDEAIVRAARLSNIVREKGLQSGEADIALARLLEIGDVKDMMASELGRGLGSLRQVGDVTKALSGNNAISVKQMGAVINSFGDDVGGLLKFTRQIGKNKWSDFKAGLHTFWINSILYGLGTHTTNIVSTLSFMAYRPLERSGAAAIASSGLLKGSDRVYFRETMELYYGYVEGFRDALRVVVRSDVVDKELSKAVVAGTKFDESVEVASRGGEILRRAVTGRDELLTMQQFKEIGVVGQGQELLARSLTGATDFMGSSDRFIKMMAARGEKRALAYRSAMDDGLEGEEFAQRVADMLNNTPISATERKILNNINDASAEYAKVTALQEELGEVGSAIVNLRDTIPGMEYVVPFVKTPSNMLDEAFLKRTPVGLASSRVRGELLAGGSRGQLAAAQMVMGTSISASIAAIYAQGNITGAGPKNASARKLWLKSHQPWSIKNNGKWYSYTKFEPVGALIGLGARLAEVIDYNSNSKLINPDDEEEFVFGVAGAFSSYVTNKSFLSGIDLLLSAAEGDNFAIEKLGAQIGGGFVPFSGALKSLNANDEYRDMDGILERIQGGLPGLSEELPHMRTPFGDKIGSAERTLFGVLPIAHRNINVGDKESVLVGDIQQEAGVVISTPKPVLKNVKLTNVQQDARMEHLLDFKVGGRGVKDALIELSKTAGYKSLPSTKKGGKGDIVISIYRKYLKASDASFLKKNPDIQIKIEKLAIGSITEERELGEISGTLQPKSNIPAFIGAK